MQTCFVTRSHEQQKKTVLTSSLQTCLISAQKYIYARHGKFLTFFQSGLWENNICRWKHRVLFFPGLHRPDVMVAWTAQLRKSAGVEKMSMFAREARKSNFATMTLMVNETHGFLVQDPFFFLRRVSRSIPELAPEMT